MCGTNSPITVRGIPCAFQLHIHDGVNRKILGSLSDHACQLNFVDWVIHRQHYSDIEECELKMCPLIWCRKRFETIDTAIRHVRTCPRLSNAWYWCPFHKYPERFLECNKGCEIVPKPKMQHASNFFNWFGHRRSVRRQAKAEFEEKGPVEADQGETSKKELDGTERFESPGSDPPLSSGGPREMMADWVDEKASYPGCQSCNADEYDGEVSDSAVNHKSVVWQPYEMEVPPFRPPRPLTKVSLQQRSSPELHHPIHSERDRDSLYSSYQRRRGMPAADRHHSIAGPPRSELPSVDVTKSATSSSSWQPTRSNASLHSAPNDQDEISSSNACAFPDEPSEPYQSRTNIHPLSHQVSPDDLAPTFNSPVTNVVSPSSPNVPLTPLTSDRGFPISPMTEYVHPPSTIVPWATATQDDLNPGTIEHHGQSVGGWAFLIPSPFQSMSEEPNSNLSLFDPRDSYIQSLLPFFNGMESSAPMAQQAENNILGSSLPIIPHSSTFEEMNSPNSDPSIHSNRFNKPSDAETSSSMIRSVPTQVDTSSSQHPSISPIAFSSVSPLWNSRTDSDPQYAVRPWPRPTQPPTSGFQISDLSPPLNRQTGLVTVSPIQEMEMSGTDIPNTNAQRLERSDEGQEFYSPGVQLPSSLDHLLATNWSEIFATGSKWYSIDRSPQVVPKYSSSHFSTSQVFSMKWLPHCFDHDPLQVSSSPPKSKQVDELQNLFRIINSQWRLRMESMPEPQSACCTLSASDLCKRAVRVLKDFICGRYIQSFEDIFALMHLAFAAAFALTWPQDFYLFSALRDDALQWRHALSRDEDKTRFLDSMDCWRLHELEPAPLFSGRHHRKFVSTAPQESFYRDNQQTLWDRLSQGEVFKACIGILEVFERADLQERNEASPPTDIGSRTRETQHLIEHITQPLRQRRGIEALQTVVTYTELEIDLGILRNTREVEVTLLNSGRVHSESREVFEDFYNSVTSQCDEAKLFLGSSCQHDWRNDHYIEALNGILKIIHNADRQHSDESAVKHGPNTGALATNRGQQPVLDPQTPVSITSSAAATLESPPNSAMSWTLTGSSQSAEADSSTTSPTTASQASISPTSSNSSTQMTSVVKCKSCSKVFTGSLQDALSNLRRHQRSSLRHNKNGGLKCPLPECEKKDPMRSDNLGPHLQNFHKMSEKSDRQSIIKECKVSAKRVDSNGKLRRRSPRKQTTDASTVVVEQPAD